MTLKNTGIHQKRTIIKADHAERLENTERNKKKATINKKINKNEI